MLGPLEDIDGNTFMWMCDQEREQQQEEDDDESITEEVPRQIDFDS